MPHTVFTSRQIFRDTWIIQGPGCDCYLLEGDREAIMIDAGEATSSIRSYAQTLVNRPVSRVINTHSHFDHTGGNGFFDVVLATEGVSRSAKNTMGAPPASYPLDYSFSTIHDGDVIDPGGRPLKILELDCHSPGDIAVLDASRRLLFTGDEVEAGQVLLLPGYAEQRGQIHARPAASVETCLRAMERLNQYRLDFDFLCPGHNGSPIVPDYIDRYRCLCGKIHAGEQGSEDCSSPTYRSDAFHFPYPNAGYRRIEQAGASLVYCDRILRDADYAQADSLIPATPLHIISSYYAV